MQETTPQLEVLAVYFVWLTTDLESFLRVGSGTGALKRCSSMLPPAGHAGDYRRAFQ